MIMRKVKKSERIQISTASLKQKKVLTKAVITSAEKALQPCVGLNDDNITLPSKLIPATGSTTCSLQVTPQSYTAILSSTEYFGKELIAALLYEDLKDREMQEEDSQYASSIHGL